MKTRLSAIAAAMLLTPIPSWAQEAPPPAEGEAVSDAAVDASAEADGRPEAPDFDFDLITVGIGAALTPSYDGSDDYKVNVLPLVQGSVAGIGISPRPGGLALDLIDDGGRDGPSFSLGPTGRIRSNRSGRIKDEVVELLPERDTAIELGVAGGVSFPKVLHQFDSLSLSSDVKWDVAGAHGGMTVSPGISYLTPLSRGSVAILSLGTEYVDEDFADYYYSVSPAEAAISGLDEFDADAGFRSASVNLLLGYDLNGNILDGGFSIFGIAGYSRLLGDAADTPLTSERGSADQFLGGLGLGYSF